MPNSIRERILQTLARTLAHTASAQGASFYRSPTVPINREQAPALVLVPEIDQIIDRPNDRVVRQLTLKITALTRGIPTQPFELATAPEPQADALLVAAHAALFTDVNLGGLCIGISEVDAEFDLEDADSDACALVQRYRVNYRTLVHDLAAKG
jgi:hypothetical protein